MKIQVYDLMGAYVAQCYELSSVNEGEPEALSSQLEALPKLLIYPQDGSVSNKCAYFQDACEPLIDDLFDAEGRPDYSSCHRVRDIFAHVESMKLHLASYFRALTPYLGGTDGDWHVICIPDSYSPQEQELILMQFPAARSKTRLLWKSIALCLSARARLVEMGAQAGSRIAVLELHDEGYSIAHLQLVYDDGVLVPQRRAYQRHPSDYAQESSLCLSAQYTCYESAGDEFYEYSHQSGAGYKLVHSEGRFVIKEFLQYDAADVHIHHSLMADADFCIIHGRERVAALDLPRTACILTPDDALCRGGAQFMQAALAQKPTYLDECEELSIVLQDVKSQSVVKEVLIPASSSCRGGALVQGQVNQSSMLAAGSALADFYLMMGDCSRDSQLKELHHQFPHKTEKAQVLTLYPSMIPGQGIAQVEVDASPLLKRRVMLNFLEMQESTKSMNSLEDEIELSYPIDFPEIESCPKKWSKVKPDVDAYLKTKRFKKEMGGLFAKASKKLMGSSEGMDSLRMLNVFGSDSRPAEDDAYFDQLFTQLKKDFIIYASLNDEKLPAIVRLIAWTYQGQDERIASVATQALASMRENWEQGVGIKVSYHTLVACCLPSNQLRLDYVHLFIRHAYRQIEEAELDTSFLMIEPYVRPCGRSRKLKKVEKVDHWVLALSRIFMRYNDFFEGASSRQVGQLAEILTIILASYLQNKKGSRYMNNVLKCLIFLLKRRRYEVGFMAESSLQYRALEFVLKQTDLPLATLLSTFLNGKGTIKGLPELLDLDNDE